MVRLLSCLTYTRSLGCTPGPVAPSPSGLVQGRGGSNLAIMIAADSAAGYWTLVSRFSVGLASLDVLAPRADATTYRRSGYRPLE